MIKIKLTGKELLETHNCSLTPTMNLKRFKSIIFTGRKYGNATYKKVKVLKQKFTCNCGKSEWREIETED